MPIYCLEEFKKEFDKLSSKKNYKTLEKEIISYFSNKTAEELSSGVRLNNSEHEPYIKKRLRGSGGFRFYFLLIIKNDKLYLMFVHPKTGPLGSSNITDDSKSMLYKKVLEAIKINDVYQMDLSGKSIVFTKEKSVVKK